MSAWGIFSFAIGGALAYFALGMTLFGFPPAGIFIGFIAFLFIGAGLEEIISSTTRQEEKTKTIDRS